MKKVWFIFWQILSTALLVITLTMSIISLAIWSLTVYLMIPFIITATMFTFIAEFKFDHWISRIVFDIKRVNLTVVKMWRDLL